MLCCPSPTCLLLVSWQKKAIFVISLAYKKGQIWLFKEALISCPPLIAVYCRINITILSPGLQESKKQQYIQREVDFQCLRQCTLAGLCLKQI